MEKVRVEIDTEYLRYNPNDDDFMERIKYEIPSFALWDKYSDSVAWRVYAWIVCLYDMNSPLRTEIKDYYRRKVYAATLVGIHANKVSGKYKGYIEKIMTGQDELVNTMIVDYITSFSSPEYTQLVAHVAIQHNMLELIIKGAAGKNEQTMFDTATDTIKRLSNLLYGAGERDEVTAARKALYKQVSSDLSEMRPENVAKRMAEFGNLPESWNPYQRGYEPNKMSFVSDDPDVAEGDEE